MNIICIQRLILLDELNLPMSDEEFLVKSYELYKEAFPSAELLTGAERLIKHLAAHDIPMGKINSARKVYISPPLLFFL